MASAQLDPQGANMPAYGPDPHGWLFFTKELTFDEVLTDPRVPKSPPTFAARGRMMRTVPRWPAASASSGALR
jgi:hypothetical protein